MTIHNFSKRGFKLFLKLSFLLPGEAFVCLVEVPACFCSWLYYTIPVLWKGDLYKPTLPWETGRRVHFLMKIHVIVDS